MIFGIKTKKDRKIEKLQNELIQEKLRNSTLTQIPGKPCKIITYQSEVLVPFEYEDIVPETTIRRNLASGLVESFEKDLILEREDVLYDRKVKYRTKLEVVVK